MMKFKLALFCDLAETLYTQNSLHEPRTLYLSIEIFYILALLVNTLCLYGYSQT